MGPITIAKWISEGLRAAGPTLAALLGWLFGYPLTWLVPRNPGLTVVLGRPGRVFADNSKYFFMYATALVRNGERVIMLTSSHEIQARITEAGAESIIHPSWHSFWLLLRCGTLVTDQAGWFNFGVYPLTRGTTLVQIWHGAPLKHIELDVYQKRLAGTPPLLRPILNFQKAMLGRYPVYDAVVTTSQRFIEDAFQGCFHARQFLPCGYPRNDILLARPDRGHGTYRLSSVNVDKPAVETVQIAREEGRSIVLYVPTFRKDMQDPFQSEIPLPRLSEFAQQHSLLVVLKLHPVMNGCHPIHQYPNLLEYAPLGDVYPLMALTDILITDYSSIFFDFLLLDRPILFFPFDLEEYLSSDREMYFNYEAMTPGAKCRSYRELERRLAAIVQNGGQDAYKEMRSKIRSYTHDHTDAQSHHRLICGYLRNLK